MMRMTFTGSLSATLSPMITAGMVSCRGRVEDDRIELLDLFRPERDRGFESLSLHWRVHFTGEFRGEIGRSALARQNGRCRRSEKGSLESVVYLWGTKG